MLNRSTGSNSRGEAGFDHERIGLIAEQAGANLVMSVLLLAVVMVVFASVLNGAILVSATTVSLAYAARYFASKCYLGASSDKKIQLSWTRIFFASALLCGISWGVFASLLISLQSPESDLMGMFLAVGLTAGAISTLGAMPWTFSVYAGAILVPASIAFAARDHRFGFAFALLGLAYIVFLLVSAVNFRRRLGIWMNHARENAQLMYVSQHDALTGLPNKSQFETLLGQALEAVESGRGSCALLDIDLDQFKVVNDTCGHATGNLLLKQAVKLIRRTTGEQALLGRLGGDEFGVFLSDSDQERAEETAKLICRAFRQNRFYARERSFRLTASIGLAVSGNGLQAASELLLAAESAAYAAKESGRDRVQVYHRHDDLLFRRNREMHWALEIPDALAEGRFFLDSQAIVGVNDSTAGPGWREILLRMLDRDGNTVLPGEFLPAAERYNLASRLDQWVIETVLESLSSNPEFLQQVDLCFINLSGQSIGDPGFLDRVSALLARSRVPAQRLCFEITETAAVDNLDQALTLMKNLHALGCRFALDDFGSGLSSFGYLRNFPVDFLKIDGAFVRDINRDPVNRAIVASITQIGHSTGKRIIAEFVESREVQACLQDIGVDYAQGYAIETPQRFLETDSCARAQLMSA